MTFILSVCIVLRFGLNSEEGNPGIRECCRVKNREWKRAEKVGLKDFKLSSKTGFFFSSCISKTTP